MIRTVLIPLLALLGVLFGVYTVVQGGQAARCVAARLRAAQGPVRVLRCRLGLMKTSTQNTGIGTPTAGVVSRVSAVVGAMVRKGDVLFEIEARQLNAELEVRKAALAAAAANVERLKSQPREELPPAEAKVAEASALLEDMRAQLAFWDRITDKRTINEDDLSKRRFAVAAAEARLHGGGFVGVDQGRGLEVRRAGGRVSGRSSGGAGQGHADPKRIVAWCGRPWTGRCCRSTSGPASSRRRGRCRLPW